MESILTAKTLFRHIYQVGGNKLKNWKEKIKSPNMIYVILFIKIVTYYCLIGVNVLHNILVLGTIATLAGLFFLLGESDIKRKKGIFVVIYSFFSVIMFADTMYYNYYNQTVSVAQLWQVSNVAKVPNSFVATLIPASFLLILDIPFIYYYFRKMAMDDKEESRLHFFVKYRIVKWMIPVIILFLAINPADSLFIKKINSVEFFSNHIRDIIDVYSGKINAKEVPANEVLEIVKENTNKQTEHELCGIAKGKNLIVVQLEAFQNFVIGNEYNGQMITPNLNKLLEEDTLYFDNYYSTVGKGNTADAEFTSLNSLYPVMDGECYRLYQDNTYNGLPWLLKDQGYSTVAFHGYNGDFWNRRSAYPKQGIDSFYAMEELEQDDIVGLGISDKSMFRQAVSKLKEQSKPFFSLMVTLSSHHPYDIDESLWGMDILPEDEGTKFAAYLQSVHYTDEAIGEFICELKEEGLYDDTVIVFYGDHHGLNCTMDNNDEIVGRYLGRTYTYDEMMNIPLLIHIPDSGVTETISTLGGQIDLLPTMANLMDLDIEQPYVLGQDLVNAKDGFAAFTAYVFEGSFAYNDIFFNISREGVFEGSQAWKIGTDEQVDIENYQAQYERAIRLKAASEDILEQDLLKDYIHRE